jgi:hypothetical protein
MVPQLESNLLSWKALEPEEAAPAAAVAAAAAAAEAASRASSRCSSADSKDSDFPTGVDNGRLLWQVSDPNSAAKAEALPNSRKKDSRSLLQLLPPQH